MVTLHSGLRMIVKARTDRTYCRETMIYRELLSLAKSDLFPRYLGSAFQDGIQMLALEFVEGRHPDVTNSFELHEVIRNLMTLYRIFTKDSLPVQLMLPKKFSLFSDWML